MANPKQEVQSNDATTVARVDMKFEIVVIPVSDVDREKEFYAALDGASTRTTIAIKTTA